MRFHDSCLIRFLTPDNPCAFSPRAWRKTYDVERTLRQAKAARESYKAMIGRGGGGGSAPAAPTSLQLALIPGALPTEGAAGAQPAAAAWAIEAETAEAGALALVSAGQGLKRGRCQALDDIINARQERMRAAQARLLAQRGGGASMAVAAAPVAKSLGGRPKNWELKKDAPDFPTMEEYKTLSAKEANSLIPVYYDCAFTSRPCLVLSKAWFCF